MNSYKMFLRTLAMSKQQLDQALAELRERYLAADETHRSQAREYVNALAEMLPMARNSNALLHHGLMIHTCFIESGPRVDQYGKPTNRLLQMSVLTLARAIAAWDRGEEYTPDERDLTGD